MSKRYEIVVENDQRQQVMLHETLDRDEATRLIKCLLKGVDHSGFPFASDVEDLIDIAEHEGTGTRLFTCKGAGWITRVWLVVQSSFLLRE